MKDKMNSIQLMESISKMSSNYGADLTQAAAKLMQKAWEKRRVKLLKKRTPAKG